MSHYSVTVPACVVQQAFAGVDVTLPLQEKHVCLHFGYDGPLAVYFLDVEDGTDYHEFGYGGRGFVPGTRLSRGQMLDILNGIVTNDLARESNLVNLNRFRAVLVDLNRFREAIVMDLPV
jgi:hypothetical protein